MHAELRKWKPLNALGDRHFTIYKNADYKFINTKMTLSCYSEFVFLGGSYGIHKYPSKQPQFYFISKLEASGAGGQT